MLLAPRDRDPTHFREGRLDCDFLLPLQVGIVPVLMSMLVPMLKVVVVVVDLV